MKRVLILLCALTLTLCLAVTARAAAPKGGYVLLETMKNVPASAADVTLPEGLAGLAQVTEYTYEDGVVRLALDREVPGLEIRELNFVEGAEKVLFTGENAASAEAERTGNDSSVFIVGICPDAEHPKFRQEYNTWSGTLSFVSAELTQKLDVSIYPAWNAGNVTWSFREDNTLLTEVRSLSNKNTTFTRTVSFAADGRAESCLVSWRSVTYGDYILDVELSPEGTPVAIECRNDEVSFLLRSEPLTADAETLRILRENSYDPFGYSEQAAAAYPELSQELLAQALATVTDLAPAKDAMEGARVWVLTFGDYSDFEEYMFVTEDPLFIVQGRKVVPNPSAKDIHGSPIDFASMPDAVTPDFDIPVFNH